MCVSTNLAKSSYVARFEDEFGTVGVKHIPQPSIKEWFYVFLPLIDEHKKQRQSVLCLEKNGQQKISGFAYW
jgi:glycine cleavage system H lipoate-binding protein